ncbi:MAG TPA: lytic transglycosylase domain-containing protein [Selenomonadales bacterium]|nr:lytic transglycosylase domain-containing protein [Selenomonadales bacterium]
MQSIQKVMQRIADIEARVQRLSDTAPSPSAGFAAALSRAERGGAFSTASHRTDIAGMVQAAAKKYNVDGKLALAVATAESGLEPSAVSPAGAAGVMQLMPETAQRLGVRDIYNPQENIDGGVRYLKQMLNTFNGDVAKAVAAYNAGPGAVQQYNGVPPYAETRDYVHRVLDLSR